MDSKKCRKCGEEKPLSEFYNDKRVKKMENKLNVKNVQILRKENIDRHIKNKEVLMKDCKMKQMKNGEKKQLLEIKDTMKN